jgi:SAM-dependent methyltransferase
MRDLLKQSFALVGIIKALRQIPFDLKRALWCIGREGDIREYLDAHTVRKLQIGAGYNMLDGWLNADFNPYTRQAGQLYLNATRRSPFPDASFDYVFSEHMIEHIWWPDGQTMLKESHRILKPGGKIRISTPNLASITSLLDPPRTPIKEQYLKLSTDKHIPHAIGYRPGFVISNFFWDFGHFFVYDAETLELALRTAGFTDIRRWQPMQSDDPNLTGIESHQKIVGDEVNVFESIILQGVKA